MNGVAAQDFGLPLFCKRAAPGFVAGLPYQLPLGVGQLLGHADLVGMEVVDLAQIGLSRGSGRSSIRTCTPALYVLRLYGLLGRVV